MPTKSRIWIVLASVLGCLLLFSLEAQPAGEQQLGRILYSNATSLRGVAVPIVRDHSQWRRTCHLRQWKRHCRAQVGSETENHGK